jgi:hypothetical protein
MFNREKDSKMKEVKDGIMTKEFFDDWLENYWETNKRPERVSKIMKKIRTD